jgi:hypothetical protein
MEKLTFKQLTRNILKDRFGLIQFLKHDMLNNWFEISKKQSISDFEQQSLLNLQNLLILRSVSWNEFELSEWFIGPILTLICFDNEDNSLFAFRDLVAVVDDCELSGKPDVMFARGIDEPQIPYFFFHEYKRETDPNGKPQPQLLGAMLAAQALNKNTKPVYGIYVVGYNWKFVVLSGNEWCESKPYSATDEEIFDIFKMLKALKEIILSY